ncbi:MAG: NifU family protein [Bdellovibrionales bacterium]|nr:NifU family protein [Bdellovibrionales bacterium]
MSLNINEEDLLVRMQYTPNPMALKFVANQAFKENGKATFSSASEAEAWPLLRDLFTVPGVKQVHVFQNTITVTHDGQLNEDQLCEQVTAVIRTRYAAHDPSFMTDEESSGGAFKPSQGRATREDPALEQMEEILDRTIRPGLQADGGDIELVKLEQDDLYIMYQGACGGCPSAMMGTLDAIQGILRHELDNPQLSVIPL